MNAHYNFNLTEYNSYHLKSFCAKAFFPETEEEIIEVYSQNLGRNIIILGNGNNIILSKEYNEDYFLILNGNFNKVEMNGNDFICEAGATMLKLSELALKHSLSGLEIFYDIPSSVGGAVVMNAGANGVEIGNHIEKVRYLDLADMAIKERLKGDLEFEYRNSFFQKNKDKVILKVWLKLRKGSKEDIKNRMLTTRDIRWAKQPREYPNCGSVFKRPEGRYVGPMIDELGLKGFSVGGGQISEKHSGFIINKGNAKGSDIIKIISVVQLKVKEKYGIDLELEQRVI